MNRSEKIKHIKENPHLHKHGNLNGLNACATIDGALDLGIIDAHGGVYGYNGGVACDVSRGPCSCGAFH